MSSRRTFGVIPISYFYQSGRATALGRAFSRCWAAWASLGLPPRRQAGLGALPVPLQQCPPVAPRLGRYAADVQFKMVRCAFDRDQLVLQHAARVIHLLQAAVDGRCWMTIGGKR